MTQLKRWFIGDYLSKTKDVFERSKIELLYHYSIFFLFIGTAFYISAWFRGFYYHAYVLTFGVSALLAIPFILKFKESVKLASIWYVIQQIITSSSEMAIQQGKADVTVGFWVMVYILFVFFLFGRTWGIILTVVMQIIAVIVSYFSQFLEIPESEKYQGTPLEIIVPFLLNIVIVWVFIKTRTEAEQEIKNQHNQIEEKSKELEIKNKDIQDSINYAKRIQYAVLPHEETIYRSIPLSFIFYKPKDIVSGDFFWFHELNRDEYILVCADCTGHGVPGAFMTVIGSSLLNQTVIDNKITKPSEILNELDKQINFTLKQQKDTDSSVQDGMDLSLIKVNKAKNQIILTSAKRPVVFVKNNVLKEIRGNKYSMGGMRTGDKVFEEIELNYSEGDVLYLYTDGYADQFGGEKGKKYSSKRLRELFSETYKLNMNEQKQKIEKSIDNWKGSHEQVDDILVIGIKF